MGVERHVRLLRDDESRAQSVNIPADLELPGEEAVIRKEGDRLIIEPVRTKKTSLYEWLSQLEPLDEDLSFLDEKLPPPRDVDL